MRIGEHGSQFALTADFPLIALAFGLLAGTEP